MKKKIMQIVSLIGLVMALFAGTSMAQGQIFHAPLKFYMKIKTGTPNGAGSRGSYIEFTMTNGTSFTQVGTLKDAALSNGVLSIVDLQMSYLESVIKVSDIKKITFKNTGYPALGDDWYVDYVCLVSQVADEQVVRAGCSATFEFNRWIKAGESAVAYNDDLTRFVFNAAFYLEKHPDLRINGVNTVAAAKNHFLTYGKQECRQSSAKFDVKYYLENNPDLKAAFGSDCSAAVNHYLIYGIHEPHRKTSPQGETTVGPANGSEEKISTDSRGGSTSGKDASKTNEKGGSTSKADNSGANEKGGTSGTGPSETVPGPFEANGNGDNALIQAVRAKDTNRAVKILNSWANLGDVINLRNARGETPVTVAAETRNSEMLLMLLSRGGSLEVAVSRLVDAGDGQTLQTVAAKYPVKISNAMFDSALTRRFYDIARFGLKHGVDPNYALQSAIAKNVRELVDPALGAGANADTALKIGMEKGDYTIATLALERYNANPDLGASLAIPKNNLAILRLALEMGANPNTGIIPAVKGGNTEIVKALLDAGGDANAGLMPALESKNRPIIELLLNRGANPTPAMPFAVGNNDISLIAMLLQKGASADDPGLISTAVSNRNLQIVEALISAGADPTNGMQAAIDANNYEITKLLVNRNARATDSQFIMKAAQNGNREIVNLLLERGSSPDDGLSGAIAGGRVDLVDLMIKRDANARNPMYISQAGTAGNPEVVKLLLEAGASARDGMQAAVRTAAGSKKEIKVNASDVVVFDADFYLAKYSDLKAAFGKNASAAKNHWLTLGIKECRQSSAGFSLKDYLERYPDLNATIGSDCEAAMKHWNANGKKENRDPSPGFTKEFQGFDPVKVVEMLIKAGAGAESPEYIIAACGGANARLATLLLNHNAPIDAIDSLGQPLIHIAALTFNPEIVTALLTFGVDPNAKNRAGDTALHIVANDEASKGYPKFKKMKKERLPVLNALITGKADVNAANARGEFVLKVSEGDAKDILKNAGAVKDQKELDKRSPKPVQSMPQ